MSGQCSVFSSAVSFFSCIILKVKFLLLLHLDYLVLLLLDVSILRDFIYSICPPTPTSFFSQKMRSTCIVFEIHISFFEIDWILFCFLFLLIDKKKFGTVAIGLLFIMVQPPIPLFWTYYSELIKAARQSAEYTQMQHAKLNSCKPCQMH